MVFFLTSQRKRDEARQKKTTVRPTKQKCYDLVYVCLVEAPSHWLTCEVRTYVRASMHAYYWLEEIRGEFIRPHTHTPTGTKLKAG